MERNETLNVICERIKALEGEVCTLRVQNNRLRVVIAALVVIAVLPYLIAAGMQTQTFSVLRVERLEFVRDDKVIAIMHGDVIPGMGSGLGIYDEAGIRMVAIVSFTGGPFPGAKGLAVGFPGVGGGVVFAVSPDGNGSMGIYNKYMKPVVALGAGSKGEMVRVDDGYLFIHDRDGNRLLAASVDPKFNNFKLQIGRTPGQGNIETAAVTITVSPGGSGVITTTNSLGLPIWTSPLR